MIPIFKNILVADDDEDDLELFKEAIAEVCPQLQLHEATDGLILMDKLKEIAPPDILFLDLNMPRMNGKECLVDIRQHTQFDATKIIILSTSSLKRDIEFCLANRADGYFVKPVTYEDLKLLIQEVLQSQK